MQVEISPDLILKGVSVVSLLGGSYVLYRKYGLDTPSANANPNAKLPHIWDYLEACYAVFSGLLIKQKEPAKWNDEDRKLLELFSNRSEIIGVNRSLDSYNLDLDNDELLIFLSQNDKKMDLFNPKFELKMENLISSAFYSEYRELINDKNSKNRESKTYRMQIAAAYVGYWAHYSYGLLKWGISIGARGYAKINQKYLKPDISDIELKYEIGRLIEKNRIKLTLFKKMEWINDMDFDQLKRMNSVLTELKQSNES